MVETINTVNNSPAVQDRNIKLIDEDKKLKQPASEPAVKKAEQNQPGQKDVKTQAIDISDALNKLAEALNRDVQFKVIDDINRVQIKVVNSQTKEVIREIPDDKLIKIAKKMAEIAGILFDETA